MGTEAFPQLLFDKVYKDDIERLRSMEEMWKMRRPPTALDYATVLKVYFVSILSCYTLAKEAGV
jgi:ubiquitin-like 1-activating enzyme E1 B